MSIKISNGLKKFRQNWGFTLIEVLVAVFIIAITATMAIPSWKSFSDTLNIGNTAKAIDSKVNLAKSYSISALNGANYGVRFEAAKVILFNANPYAVIEEYDLPATMEIYDVSLNGGGTDVTFNRLTGTTDNYGSVKVRIISDNSRWKQIFINTEGQTGANLFNISAGASKMEDTINNINARHLHFTLAAWTIQSPATSKLRLDWIGTIQEIDTASYFSAGIFDWQGQFTVNGSIQKLRIHTLGGGNLLCIMRDRTENDKTLTVSFIDNSITKGIVTYTENADGTVTVTPNTIYVSSPILSQ